MNCPNCGKPVSTTEDKYYVYYYCYACSWSKQEEKPQPPIIRSRK